MKLSSPTAWGRTRPPLLTHWLILGGAILLFGLAGAIYVYQEWHRTRAREEERLLSQARVVEQNLGQNLVAANQVLVNIRKQFPLPRSSTEFNLYLAALTDAMPGARTLLVLNGMGDVVGASRSELAGRNFSEREYFREVKARPDPDLLYVSPPFHTALGIYSITVSRALLDSRGQFDGVVVATLNPAYLIPLLESVRYTPDILTSLVHWNGTRFLVRPEITPFPGKNLLQPGSYFSMHRNGNRDASVFSGTLFSNGEQRMIAQRTVRPAGLKMDQPMVVAVSRRLEGIYATWWRDVKILGTIYGLISLASVFALRAYQRKHVESAAREIAAIRKLEENDRFMKTVTDHLPGMVAYWTAELRCRFANSAYFEWFGKTPEQMRGIRIQDLMGPDLFAKNEPYIRAALRGERPQFERTLIKADGSIGYTWAQYIPDMVGDKVNGFVVLVSDVTRLKQTELALAENEWTLKTIIATEPECVAIMTADGVVTQMNPAGIGMMGAESEGEVIGARVADMVVAEYRPAFIDLNAAVFHGTPGKLAFELVNRKGEHRWLDGHAVPMRDKVGKISGSLWVIRDFSERKRAELELERLAQTDFLTGLSNRRHFIGLAEKELTRTRRYGGPLSVLMIDLDHFKKINDTYGHSNGDLVLQGFATRCIGALRQVDIVGRFGGEEFAVILPQTDEAQAVEVAERLRQAIQNAEIPLEHGLPIRFTVSIGIASLGDEVTNLDTLLNWADSALYDAKNAGRNQVRVYKKAL